MVPDQSMINVAIIEDSRVLSQVYQNFLSESRFKITIFNSTPKDIQALLDKNDFQMVLCPCFPKHQEGPEIVEKIKADPHLSSAAVVLSTSLQREKIPLEWDMEEINSILLKPFDQERLLKTLSRAYFLHHVQRRKIPKALVIDDSKAVQKILRQHLTDMGFSVQTEDNGKEGLKAALEIRPDIILVDVEMPVMNGFEFCRQVGKHPRIEHTPIVVVSGTIDQESFQKGFDAGIVDFLQKPINAHALSQIIDSVSMRGELRTNGTTVILSKDTGLCNILSRTLNFLHSRIRIYERLDELKTHLRLGTPDIIVLDLAPYENKLDTCRQVRMTLEEHSAVIIAIAEESDRDVMFQCFKSGATEFLIKPFGRDEVRARIQNHLQLKSLRDELIRKNKILESLAYKDELTGLMNRRYFDKALEEEIHRASNRNSQLSFLMMDLDNFKQINDQYGHEVGDEVLKHIGTILMENTPDDAIPCRYGGEEFCIIYPETQLTEALKSCERIRRFCTAAPISEHRIFQTISGGLSCFPHTSSGAELVADADHCLYEAKKSGKNKIIACTPTL